MKRKIRADIKIGTSVGVIIKSNQGNGLMTEGIVKEILTKLKSHSHGTKVKLENNQVGRVTQIIN